MASDIKVSELNEITRNKDFNEVIINDKATTSDLGVTKRIQMCNLLTRNIVNTVNIRNGSVTGDKIALNTINGDNLINNTITCNQIASKTITTDNIALRAVGSCQINPDEFYRVSGLTVPGSGQVRAGVVLATERLKTCTGRIDVGTSTQYTLPEFQIANRFLKTDGAGTLSWDTPVEGNATSLVVTDIFPVGTIVPWGGDSLPADGKWLPCNGGTFSSDDYPELAAILGSAYGAVDGNIYKLPDLEGRVPIGTGTGNDGTRSKEFPFCAIGNKTGGKYCTTLTYDQMPAHRHVSPFGENPSVIGSGMRWGQFTTTAGRGSRGSMDSDNSIYGFTTFAGGGSVENGASTGCSSTSPHNNIQPYTIVRYIIKASKDDLQDVNITVGKGLSALDHAGVQASNVTLSSTEIGVKIDQSQFQFSGSNQIQLKPKTIVTDTEFVRVNGGTVALEHREDTTSGVVREYCLCDFTDAGGILDASTRCDIRGVYVGFDVFNANGNRCSEIAINTDNQGPGDPGGTTTIGYDVIGRYSSRNGDDDGGTGGQTYVALNKGITSFCLQYNFTPAGNKQNHATSRIVGVQINKYA